MPFEIKLAITAFAFSTPFWAHMSYVLSRDPVRYHSDKYLTCPLIAGLSTAIGIVCLLIAVWRY